MQSFIYQILQELFDEEGFDLEKTTFVLPSKRSGGFLKKELKKFETKTRFAPSVLSTEEFVEKVSGLYTIDHTQSLFALYETYRDLTPKKQREDFEIFYGWAQNLIYDFNEIDRYRIDAEDLFNYLARIKDIEHWSAPGNQTEMIKNYLQFWNRQSEYYLHFKDKLLSANKAYQGLIYRQASEKVLDYLQTNSRYFVFIGFNALNNAEQKIITSVLEANRGTIFWDIDRWFFEDQNHEAGLFMRRYLKQWDFYKNNPLRFKRFSDHFSNSKNVQITQVAKNVGQAKLTGKILADFPKEELSQTAVVLNDEALLLPLLNSLPQNIGQVNITMGLPLPETPIAAFVETLFEIQIRGEAKIYYRFILDILSNPSVKSKLGETGKILRDEIIAKNKIYLDPFALELPENQGQLDILRSCFQLEKNPHNFLGQLEALTEALRPGENQDYPLQTEYLFHFNRLFKKLGDLLERQSEIKTIRGLKKIYQDAVKEESLDFEGSPFSGLQIMGMLETRSLNFKNIILLSVNEGILPAGKSQNSFIPYDLKREYGLPTYREKDAVYTYHFYRLLQRAENIHLLYNSDKSGLNGGEPSRFIMQLETEATHFNIKKQTGVSRVPAYQSSLQEIPKNQAILDKLQKLAKNGFSPSALTAYIRNPVDFYQRYVHGIRDQEEVEETVAYNTLGTVVHETLDKLHQPFLKNELNDADLKKMQGGVEQQVQTEFENHYGDAFYRGKNRLIYEVAQRYVHNFLKLEKKEIKAAPLKLIYLEEEFTRKLPKKMGGTPVKLKGKLDRVDYYNGIFRVIDYKTGKVEQRDLTLKKWDGIHSDYKYSKAFQVLCYAYLLQEQFKNEEWQCGIISFKNLREEFMNLQIGPKKKRQEFISDEILSEFEGHLNDLIAEILDPETPFIEKEI